MMREGGAAEKLDRMANSMRYKWLEQSNHLLIYKTLERRESSPNATYRVNLVWMPR